MDCCHVPQRLARKKSGQDLSAHALIRHRVDQMESHSSIGEVREPKVAGEARGRWSLFGNAALVFAAVGSCG